LAVARWSILDSAQSRSLVWEAEPPSWVTCIPPIGDDLGITPSLSAANRLVVASLDAAAGCSAVMSLVFSTSLLHRVVASPEPCLCTKPPWPAICFSIGPPLRRVPPSTSLPPDSGVLVCVVVCRSCCCCSFAVSSGCVPQFSPSVATLRLHPAVLHLALCLLHTCFRVVVVQPAIAHGVFGLPLPLTRTFLAFVCAPSRFCSAAAGLRGDVGCSVLGVGVGAARSAASAACPARKPLVVAAARPYAMWPSNAGAACVHLLWRLLGGAGVVVAGVYT